MVSCSIRQICGVSLQGIHTLMVWLLVLRSLFLLVSKTYIMPTARTCPCLFVNQWGRRPEPWGYLKVLQNATSTESIWTNKVGVPQSLTQCNSH